MSQESQESPEGFEPSPTSPPPEDVNIPVETVYGDNTPMEPIDVQKSKDGENPSNTNQNIGNNKSSNTNVSESNISDSNGKVLDIGWIGALIFLILFGTGTFYLGGLYKEKIKGGSSAAQPPLNLVGEDTTSNTNKTNTNTDSGETAKKTINFFQDKGIYKRGESVNSEELTAARVKQAKKSIVWITSEPNNEKILSILAAIKNKNSMPIYIITDSETKPIRIKRAEEFGFSVNQFESALEAPFSCLLIDGMLLMDISRNHWIWETTDKAVIKSTGKWANDLIKNSKIVDKN
jgi:hypothetical protein